MSRFRAARLFRHGVVDTASDHAQDAGNPMREAHRELTMAVKDSNGTVLSAGDNVVVIKDLKVKGSSIPLKRGTVIRNIRVVEDDDENVEGNSDKIKGLVLKACFLKKA